MSCKWFLLSCVIFLASCSTDGKTEEVRLLTSPQPTFTATITHTKTATWTATASITPTITSTKTPVPTPTMTPLPWSNKVINASNITQLTLHASWGRGYVKDYQLAGSDKVMVLSSLGVYLYQLQDLKLLASFPDAVQYSIAPDQSTAAIVFRDGALKIIDIATAEIKFQFDPLDLNLPADLKARFDLGQMVQFMDWYYQILPLTYSSDSNYLAMSQLDGSIQVWNLGNGEPSVRLYHDAAGMDGQLMFTSDSNNLLSTGKQPLVYFRNNSLSYWSLSDGQMLWYGKEDGRLDQKLISPDGSLFGLLFRPKGSTEEVIRIFTKDDGQLIGQINGMITENPYSPDSKYFVSFHKNNVLVWQLWPVFQLIRTLYPSQEVSSAGFSSDGTQVEVNAGQFSYQAPEYLKMTENQPQEINKPEVLLITGQQWRALGHLQGNTGITMTADQQLYLWGGKAATWRWAPLKEEIVEKSYEANPISPPVLSLDGTFLAACFETHLQIDNLIDELVNQFERCLPEGVLAFSPNGTTLALSVSNRIKTISVQDGSLIQDYIGSGLPIVRLIYSPDGRYLASIGYYNRQNDFFLWDTVKEKGVPLQSDGSQWGVTDVAYSHDGKFMVVSKQVAWVISTEDGLLRGKLPAAGSLALSLDDTLLAVGGYDGIIRIFDMASREEIINFQAHQVAVNGLMISDDGANLISTAGDGSVKLWGIP